MIYSVAGDLSDMAVVATRTTKALRERREEFDSIAVRGMSGALIGSIVSVRLKKPLVVVRKPGEEAHGCGLAVNAGNVGKRVLFLDDFVSTGRTKRAVIEVIEKLGGEVVLEYEYERSKGVQEA